MTFVARFGCSATVLVCTVLGAGLLAVPGRLAYITT